MGCGRVASLVHATGPGSWAGEVKGRLVPFVESRAFRAFMCERADAQEAGQGYFENNDIGASSKTGVEVSPSRARARSSSRSLPLAH